MNFTNVINTHSLMLAMLKADCVPTVKSLKYQCCHQSTMMTMMMEVDNKTRGLSARTLATAVPGVVGVTINRGYPGAECFYGNEVQFCCNTEERKKQKNKAGGGVPVGSAFLWRCTGTTAFTPTLFYAHPGQRV